MSPGPFPGIWSDMHIETTFMRYGNGKFSIIGVTLKSKTFKVWALFQSMLLKAFGKTQPDPIKLLPYEKKKNNDTALINSRVM